MIKRDNNSAERDVAISSGNSAYVSSHTDENENLRFLPSGHPIRYDDEQYHHRYEYHHHPHQASAQGSSLNNNNLPVGEEIKVELIRNQHTGKIQVYEHDGSGHSRSDEQNQSGESKIHYTNLDSIVPSQNYYISAEGYQAGSGFTYLSTGPNKDYTVYHQSSPNTVLYKGNCFKTISLNHDELLN